MKYQSNSKATLTLFVIVIACYLIYYPVSFGGFVYDDLPNIVWNSKIHIESLKIDDLLIAITSSESGPLKRPVSMLSFALNYYFAGLNPSSYKLVNIIIHLMNGVLVFVLTRMILASKKLALRDIYIKQTVSLAVAAMWLLHPIHVSSVAYIVQRMNELAMFFTFTGLIFFMHGRRNLEEGNGGKFIIGISFVICGILSLLSKENGALIFLFIVLLEIFFFHFGLLKLNERLFLSCCYFVFILTPIVIVSLTLIVSPDIFLKGYQQYDFNLFERMLTEFRVLWIYIQMILIPDISQYSLHHDDITISKGLFSPLTTIASLIGIVLLVTASFIARNKLTIFSFGILFFLSGHLIESTILPLQAVFEHRNYTPSYGVLLIVAYYLSDNTISPGTLRVRQILLLVFILILGFSSYIKTNHWRDTELLPLYEIEHKPQSSQLNYAAGRFYAKALDTDNVDDREKVYKRAESYFRNAIELNNNNIEAMAGLIILSSSNGYNIDNSILEELSNALQSRVISVTGMSAMNALFNCHLTNECRIQDKEIDLLINSILKNPYIQGNRLERIYDDICEYYVKRDKLENALQVAKRGLAKTSDSVSLRIIYTSLLIKSGDIEEAREQLEYLQSINNEQYRQLIRSLSMELNKLQ